MTFRPTKPREYGSTKDVISRLIDEGGGVKQAAFLLDRSLTQAYAYADPATPDQMSLDQARRLAAATGATAAARDFAALAGGIFMPLEPSADPLAELAAQSSEHTGGLMAALLRASADHKITAEEARGIITEADQLLRAVVALRAKLTSIATGENR